jgi:hypothetical protein
MKFVLAFLSVTGLTVTMLPGSAFAQETSRTYAPSNGSKVGLALEPMLIYTRETSNIRTSQLPIISDDTSGTSQGGGVGLKVGGHIAGIITAGVDGRYSQTRMTDSSYGNAKAISYNVGPTVGVQMPIVGLRLFATYVPFGAYDPAAGDRGFDVRFRDPQGYRLGAGFHIGPVSLNLEYEDIRFRNTLVQSVGGINQPITSDIKFDTRGYDASVSFPLEI